MILLMTTPILFVKMIETLMKISEFDEDEVMKVKEGMVKIKKRHTMHLITISNMWKQRKKSNMTEGRN